MLGNKYSEKNKGVVVLVAGGTGGHLFPAKALCKELLSRGHEVHIITDVRAIKLINNFEGSAIYVVRSATLKSKSPIALLNSIKELAIGSLQSFFLLKRIKPDVVGGFGGYPTLPPMFVATSRLLNFKKPKSFIHEQNAVMGRANKFLASRVNIIAGGFLEPAGKWFKKITKVGNPVGEEVLKYSTYIYKPSESDKKFNLLVFGGSQGTTFFSDIVPKALALLPQQYRDRLVLVQQSRNDTEELRNIYSQMAIKAEIAPFFSDLPYRMANAHFIISRSGASTVSEISVIGRPALLVPYPYALDHDQQKNAENLAKAGAALIYHQEDLTPEMLCENIIYAMDNSTEMLKRSRKAKRVGQPQATQHLADIVDKLIAGDKRS